MKCIFAVSKIVGTVISIITGAIHIIHAAVDIQPFSSTEYKILHSFTYEDLVRFGIVDVNLLEDTWKF